MSADDRNTWRRYLSGLALHAVARRVSQAQAGMGTGPVDGPRWESFLRGVVRRVLAGDEPQPWWMPRRVLTVVSADVDTTTGVGAIWVVARPKSPRTREHIALLEWHGEQWRHVGGNSSPADDCVDVDVLDVHHGGAS